MNSNALRLIIVFMSFNFSLLSLRTRAMRADVMMGVECGRRGEGRGERGNGRGEEDEDERGGWRSQIMHRDGFVLQALWPHFLISLSI